MTSVVESDTLSRLLKKIRREQGWTQKQLAARIGVCDTMVRHYEAGRSDMKASKLLALLEEIGWTWWL